MSFHCWTIWICLNMNNFLLVGRLSNFVVMFCSTFVWADAAAIACERLLQFILILKVTWHADQTFLAMTHQHSFHGVVDHEWLLNQLESDSLLEARIKNIWRLSTRMWKHDGKLGHIFNLQYDMGMLTIFSIHNHCNVVIIVKKVYIENGNLNYYFFIWSYFVV